MESLHNHLGEALDFTLHPGDGHDALVILGHGVTGNKDRPLLLALADGLSARGWPCLRFSFAGNGNSAGRFEESCPTKEVAELRAVLDAVAPGRAIAYAGHSLGGAVGVLAAADDPRIKVLVSLAGMTCMADFAKREFGGEIPGEGRMWEEPSCPLSQTFMDDMASNGDTLDAASRVRQPWLLIHGLEDDVVPPGDGEAAHAAAPGPKLWLPIPGAGHSFDESSWPAIVEAIDKWLGQHL